MDVHRIVDMCNGPTDCCSKDSDASTNHVDRSPDDSTIYGSMNGFANDCQPVCNGVDHPGETASDSHCGQMCDTLNEPGDSLEQNNKDSAVSVSENGSHDGSATELNADLNDCHPAKLKPLSEEPLSEEMTVVDRNSSLDVTAEDSNTLDSKVVCSEVVGTPIACEVNTDIDFSYLELETIPESLFSMPATTELCLDFNDLTELPDALFERLSCLRVLSLMANNLTRLADSVSLLTRLEVLNVSQNSLSSLPPSIGSLNQLQSINFSQNRISDLPSEFGRLSRLEKIIGFGNLLTCLPQTFGRLENLVSVDLSGNQLKALSHSFGFLVRLKILNLSSNGLDRLPESITCVSTLETLDISNNVLDSLPDKLQCLQKLKQLYIGNNRLKLLPAWLEHLPALEELRLEKNLLTGSPLSDTLASNCRKLRVLNLSRNLMRNITSSIVGLENLEWLDLGNGDDEQRAAEAMTRPNTGSTVYNWIWQLPKHFDCLKHLKHLNLYAIRLEELPDDFGYLANLEWLNLGANELRDLPQSFCEMRQLKFLILSMNQLELLPLNFGDLSKLEELRLDRNRLAELPQSFCRLTRLHRLDLFSNSLNELPLFLQSFAQLKFVNLDENCFKGCSLQLMIDGKRITVVKRKTSPTMHCCAGSDWLENIESRSREISPINDDGHVDETNGKSLGTEDEAKEESISRPGSYNSSSSCGSQAKVSMVRREEDEEEEEDWDRELMENNPFVDSELPGDSSLEVKVAPGCCSNDCLPFVSFIPSTWHAPKVSTCHSTAARPSLFPYSPFSQPTFNNDQFEDADEEESS